MEYIKGLEMYQDSRETAVTLGKLDGLHRGHQKLIRKICELKEQHNIKTVVCAFDMIPLREKLGLPIQGIMTNEERRDRLEEQVDCLVECPFTDEISNMSAEDFIEKVLHQHFHAKYIVVGTDFYFGHNKRGNVDMLSQYAEKFGYELFVIEKEMYGDRDISSTYIREELRKGNMKAVNEMLGYTYSVRGTVEHGRKLGRKLGFPTLNVHPAKEKLLPPNGVYLDSVKIDGKWYNAIGNVGYKPTVANVERLLIESHLFGYEGDAYGKEVEIRIYYFKRPEQRFDSVEEMAEQIHSDIEAAKEYFGLDR